MRKKTLLTVGVVVLFGCLLFLFQGTASAVSGKAKPATSALKGGRGIGKSASMSLKASGTVGRPATSALKGGRGIGKSASMSLKTSGTVKPATSALGGGRGIRMSAIGALRGRISNFAKSAGNAIRGAMSFGRR